MYVNAELKRLLSRRNETVLFGQNVDAGSCISGLTRGLVEISSGRIFNTPNCENTEVGFGFGMMIGGVSSIFFMKQLDFLLLGIDQIVNTGAFVRTRRYDAGFTIMPAITDNGYQGIQSSLNTLPDFCSIADTAGYTVTNRHDITAVFERHLLAPGFRIIGVSQRLFGEPLLDPGTPVAQADDASWLQYSCGEDVTVVCFNFSLPQGMELVEEIKRHGKSASLYTVNATHITDWRPLIKDAIGAGRLAVLDDGKSMSRTSHHFLLDVATNGGVGRVETFMRPVTEDRLRPFSDRLEIDAVKATKIIFNG